MGWLCFGGNCIGAAGAKALAGALRGHPTVTSFDGEHSYSSMSVCALMSVFYLRAVHGMGAGYDTFVAMLRFNFVLRNAFRFHLRSYYRVPLVRIVVRTRVMCQFGHVPCCARLAWRRNSGVVVRARTALGCCASVQALAAA
jgi:hypothetical protein